MLWNATGEVVRVTNASGVHGCPHILNMLLKAIAECGRYKKIFFFNQNLTQSGVVFNNIRIQSLSIYYSWTLSVSFFLYPDLVNDSDMR